MKKYYLICALASILFFLSSNTAAAAPVSSAPCPYSCKSLGIKKRFCKDWRQGNTCYVQDLRKKAPVTIYKKGLVSSANCPYSCRTQGIPKKYCKDWKQGGRCYIEDLRKAPQAAPTTKNPLPPTVPTTAWPTSPINPGGNGGFTPAPDRQACNNFRHGQMARPRINISKVEKSGNIFKDKYRVFGSVEGICLVEAGYFENSTLKQKFNIGTTTSFRRFNFETVIRKSRNPEIRVYNSQGLSDSLYIDPELYGSDGYYQGDNNNSNNNADGNLFDAIFGSSK